MHTISHSKSLTPSLWSSHYFLCTALTHNSPVCFVPCLTDGPEISPQQEEGAVPHISVSSATRLSAAFCQLGAVFLSVSVCLYYYPVLCILLRVLSLWWIAGSFLNPPSSLLYCWCCSFFGRCLPPFGSPVQRNMMINLLIAINT